MRVEEIMTSNPACCCCETPIQDVARLMIEQDCGAIPVVEEGDRPGRVLGVITDRDIAVRTVAAGRHPSEVTAREAMSHPVATVYRTASLIDCLLLMEQNQVRRMPVVDQSGCIVGIIAQADIARHTDGQVATLVQQVSRGFDPGH